jgi:hypothetical protein
VAGDIGVVIYGNRLIPVFVADTGKSYRIGEGSAALLRAVGIDRCMKRNTDGYCTQYNESSVEDSVLFFIFPHSKIPDLKKETALAVIRQNALKKFDDLIKSLN